MIVDVHTHVFPPLMVEQRESLAEIDPGFAEIYGNPDVRMATAEELLASMDTAKVDISVAVGFWWHSAELAEKHADYLLSSAAASDGRIVPFVPVGLADANAEKRLRQVAESGAQGLGEVRPSNQPLNVQATDALLGRASEELALPALVHASEPVGHHYPGKEGGYTPGALWALVERQPVRVIAAHWGGGFPFYALMPEVRKLLSDGRLVFDTAASTLLYDTRVFAQALELIGDGLVLWGSDFPLRDQAKDRAAVEAALPDAAKSAAVLGENAVRFLGL